MILSSENLNKLRVGYSQAFKRGLGNSTPLYKAITMIVPATQKEQKYGWLGKFARIRKWIGARVIQNISESDYSIKEFPWEQTYGVDRDDIETDNLGLYSMLFEGMGQSVAEFPDELVWELLAKGFSTNCYDGQFFFDTDHPVLDVDGVTVLSVANTDGGTGNPWFLIDVGQVMKPIILQIRRDFGDIVARDKVTDDNVFDFNEFRYGVDARMNVGFGFWQYAWGSKQGLTPDTYETANNALTGMKGDHGKPVGGAKKFLLVVGASNQKAARAVVASQLVNGGETNPWAGTAEVLVVPWLT